MIGGEMPTFVEDRPAAGGALFGYLIDRLPAGGNVLIAGPHDDALVDALAARSSVTCLVRSQPKAAELDARGLDVLCGSLAKIIDVERYDVVVALDGLGRLCSVEGPQYDWAESLQALKRTLRPGGTLLLAVENELGVHRLVDPGSATSAHTDGDWRPLGEFDTKPGNPTRLAGKLSTEGLAVDWLAAAWPVPAAPTLIATPNALQDGPVDALAAVTAAAVGQAYADRAVLSDPRRLAAAAVRGGLGPEFAAAWLVVAHRAPRPAAAISLPSVLLGDGPVLEIGPGLEGDWVRRVIRQVPGRDLSVLAGPLPTGRLLEELLLGAALRHDLPLLDRGVARGHPRQRHRPRRLLPGSGSEPPAPDRRAPPVRPDAARRRLRAPLAGRHRPADADRDPARRRGPAGHRPGGRAGRRTTATRLTARTRRATACAPQAAGRRSVTLPVV
jgi:SAM-dependent methyltransferase